MDQGAAYQADAKETPLCAEEIEMFQHLWRMSGWDEASQRHCATCIGRYAKMITFNRHFTRGVMFNRYMGDQMFLVCAVSTGESTRASNDDFASVGAGLSVSECY